MSNVNFLKWFCRVFCRVNILASLIIQITWQGRAIAPAVWSGDSVQLHVQDKQNECADENTFVCIEISKLLAENLASIIHKSFENIESTLWEFYLLMLQMIGSMMRRFYGRCRCRPVQRNLPFNIGHVSSGTVFQKKFNVRARADWCSL